MKLNIRYSALLAFILLAVSSQDASALPAKLGDVVTLPLHIMPRSLDEHPQLGLQRRINRNRRRAARMTRRDIPTDLELRSNIQDRIALISRGEGTSNEITHRDNSGGDGDNTNSNDGAGAVLPNGVESVANATTPTAPDSLPIDIESNDVGYFTIIQVGTPPRDFRVTVDSGSSDFWVEGENCQADSGGPCAADHAVLSGNTSSTFVDTHQPWNITYGSGDVAGTIVSDTVIIDNLTLTNHTFGVANQESADFSDFAIPYDGLIGLALSSLSNQGVLTPVESLAKQGLIKEAITSYKISRLADGGHDGEITFGGVDPTKFNASTLIAIPNISKEGFWEGSMDAAAVNGVPVKLGANRTAIFDTGTTGILAPSDDARAIHAAISGAKSDGQGGFTLPCTTNATISLTFGGRAFTIEPKDLAEDPVDANNPDGACTSSISGDTGGDDGPTQWLLGDTFLKNVYLSTNVDQNTVSLAIPVNPNSTQQQQQQQQQQRATSSATRQRRWMLW